MLLKLFIVLLVNKFLKMKPFGYLSLVICCLFTACSKEDISETQSQVVAQVALHITDPIPETVSMIRFTNLSDKSYEEKQISATDIGKKDVELILNLHKLVATMDAEVTVYYKDKSVSNGTISNIVPIEGKIIMYSGDLFNNGLTVQINPVWQDDPILIGF